MTLGVGTLFSELSTLGCTLDVTVTDEKLFLLSTLSIDHIELRLSLLSFVSQSRQHPERISFRFL